MNPFTKFGDRLDYVLAPGGGFNASVDGWQLSGGAKVVKSDKGSSLQLPQGAKAISPSICIDLNYPTFRFYNKVVKSATLALGSADDADIRVEVVHLAVRNPMWEEVKTFDGKQGTSAGSGWRLSDPVQLKPDLGGARAGARQVALRFTADYAKRGDSFLVDDVYIDPMRR